MKYFVDHKSRNKIQETKSKANPSLIPSGRNDIPDVRKKIPGLRNTFQHFLEWKPKLGISPPLM